MLTTVDLFRWGTRTTKEVIDVDDEEVRAPYGTLPMTTQLTARPDRRRPSREPRS